MSTQTRQKVEASHSRVHHLVALNNRINLDNEIKQHEKSKKARKRRSLKCIGDRQELSKPEACYVVGVEHDRLDNLISDGLMPQPIKKRPIPLWDGAMLIEACDELERAKDEELAEQKRRVADHLQS